MYVFDRLLAQLCSIYAIVARKRAVCENVAQDCRTLFKPWYVKCTLLFSSWRHLFLLLFPIYCSFVF